MNAAKFFFIFFGILLLFGAIFELSLAMHNDQVLHQNEALGYYNQKDEDTVQYQYTCATTLFVLTAIFIAIGIAIRDKSAKTTNTTKREMYSPPPPPPSIQQSEDIRDDIYEKIKALKKMKEEGFITEEEYEEKRKELLFRF